MEVEAPRRRDDARGHVHRRYRDHFREGKHWDLFQCRVLDHAPEWDGHTPAQAIERINGLKRVLVTERFGDGFGVGE